MADEAQLDAIARANAFAIYNGITTHQTGDGTAEAILEIGPDSLNPYGLLQEMNHDALGEEVKYIE